MVPEFRLGADVPVKILHRLDDAGVGHLVEITLEFRPGPGEGRSPKGERQRWN